MRVALAVDGGEYAVVSAFIGRLVYQSYQLSEDDIAVMTQKRRSREERKWCTIERREEMSRRDGRTGERW